MKLKLWVKITILIITISLIFISIKQFRKKDDIDDSVVNKIINFENYQDLYVDEYQVINNIESEDDLNFVNIFLDKGYKGNEINYILTLSEKNQNKLKIIDYIDISKFYQIKNYDVDKTQRYLKYQNNNTDLNIEEIVTHVNINLDLKAYEITNEVEDPNSYLVLVNKYNFLPQNYKPEDLISIDGYYQNQTVTVRQVVADAWLKLQAKGLQDGINLLPTTAFRSSSFQKTLYTNYVNKDGVEAADTYSARPGFSEHQTGLAIDLKNPQLSNIRLNEDDYSWLKANCADFGFIIRFPANKENITLYQEENWHIRYVGKDIAKIIMDNKLTLEEYIDLYITEY
ncbi:MAG: D-alanyl-D-alanine carboxypeptidase family protein [Firmicutes bacterium]|nr:D-alanyl-D-alanine carboxypeptidase family protein [Bacillota bacterium]